MPHHQSRQPPRPMGGPANIAPGSLAGFVPRLEHRSDGLMMPPHGMAPHPHHSVPWGPPHPAFHHPSNLANHYHHHHHQTPPGVIGDARVHLPIMSKTVSYDSGSSSSAFVASPAHLSPKQDYSSLKTATKLSPSFDNNKMVSSVPEQPKTEGDNEDHSLSTERSRPLKKRKTVTPHVSPMSSGHTAATEECSAATTTCSYQDDKTKDEKVNSTTTETKSSTTVAIPHLPTVLHKLLTDSDYADKVVQWLPHGKAWRIVRWEALRRQVLPEFFPQLLQQQQEGASAASGSAGSVDAFMWHLTAWGFEEITDGTDAGAYSHPMFSKEDPELCRQMHFAPDDYNTTTTSAPQPQDQETPEKTKDSHSILRVPSLATPSTESSRRFVEIKSGGVPPSPPNFGPHTTPPAARMVNYRADEEWSGAVAIRSRGMPPYSPIRIRSSRGGGRMNHNNNNRTTSRPCNESRRGFPVSNRGRRPMSLTQRSDDNNNKTETSLRMLEENPRKSPDNSSNTQPRSVLKRRLPMSTKSKDVEQQEEQEEIKTSSSSSESSAA